jgi:signal peptidase II
VKKRLAILSISGIIIVLDQITKFWISQNRPNLQVIPGFFNIHYVENTGAAFGILQGKQIFLTLVSIIAIGVLLFLIIYEREEKRGMLYALALILGGTCGNLIDRLRLGYVVDFLQFYVKFGGNHYYWPSFNVADSAITTGVGILIIVTLWQERMSKKDRQKNNEIL